MILVWIIDHYLELHFAIAFAFAVWIAIDASKNQVPVDSKPYGWNNGAVAWFLSTVVFSIYIVVYYLWKRHRVLKDRADRREQNPSEHPRHEVPPDKRRPSR